MPRTPAILALVLLAAAPGASAQCGLAASPPVLFAGSDSNGDDQFGTSVALQGDLAVVGAPRRFGGALQNSVYVQARVAGVWTEEAILRAPIVADDRFGASVALDGDTVVVGAPDAGAGKVGSAWVFVRQAGSWTMQAELAWAYEGQGGASVALDGDTAIVGDPGGLGMPGAVHVFTRTAGAWSHEATLRAAVPFADAWFGFAVSLEGDVLVVGAPADGFRARTGGAVHAFLRSGTTWTQEGTFVAATTVASDRFGTSVALSGDTLVVGAQGPLSYQGRAYAFRASGATFTEEAVLVPPPGNAPRFDGFAVAARPGWAVVGGPTTSIDGVVRGIVHVYWRDGGSWLCESSVESPGTVAQTFFGGALALSGDEFIVGAQTADARGWNSGEAWLMSYCAETDCANGVDDDGDSDVDCADPGCQGQVDGAGMGCEPLGETSCTDAADNDGDGSTDCADADCQGSSCPELCADGLDNDGDGTIDCLDPDCVGLPGPSGPCEPGRELSCADGGDNDVDGAVDCDDRDCWGTTVCGCPGEGAAPAVCEGHIIDWCHYGWDEYYWDFHVDDDWDGDGNPANDNEGSGCRMPIPRDWTVGPHDFAYRWIRYEPGGGRSEMSGQRPLYVVPRPPEPVPSAAVSCSDEPVRLSCGTEAPCASYAWDLDPLVDSDGAGGTDDDPDLQGCDVLAVLPPGTTTVRCLATNPSSTKECLVAVPLAVFVPDPPALAPSAVVGCGGAATALACGGGGAGISFAWDLDAADDADGNGDPLDDGDASGCDVAVVLARGTRTVHVIATASDGCRATAALLLTVPGPEAPRATAFVDCPVDPVRLSCGSPLPGHSYAWDLDVSNDADLDGDPANDRDVLGCDASVIVAVDVVARSIVDDGACAAWTDVAIDIGVDTTPAEVHALRVTRAGDAVALRWGAATGATFLRVLRGDLLQLLASRAYGHAADDAAGRGACDAGAVATWTDPDDVRDPTTFYYLVTGVNACSGLEGSTGFGWNGTPFERPPRLPSGACP